MRSRATPLVLTVFALGFLSPMLPAQRVSVRFMDPPLEETTSHRRLGGGLEDMTDPEAALERRLSRMRNERYQKAFGDRPLDDDLARLAKKLFDDPQFRESVKGQFDPEEIERLERMLGEGTLKANDKSLRALLDTAKSNPGVTDQDRAALDKIAEKLPDSARPAGGNAELPNAQPPAPQELSGPTPRQPDGVRGDDWLKGAVDALIKDADRWADTPTGKSWAESLKNLANRAEAGRSSTAQLGEQTSALSRWFGGMNGGNPGFQPPRLGNPSLPSLPNMGAPSGGMLAGSSGVLVALLGMLLLGLLLWRGRDWLATARGARRSAWKLGPWPVRPEDVATRGDLVRAFEYLALLCLGPSARTCHHLELGTRIGQQPALDVQRRRESAAALSRLYERARYTPDQEPLPGEELRRARRELAYLAGV